MLKTLIKYFLRFLFLLLKHQPWFYTFLIYSFMVNHEPWSYPSSILFGVLLPGHKAKFYPLSILIYSFLNTNPLNLYFMNVCIQVQDKLWDRALQLWLLARELTAMARINLGSILREHMFNVREGEGSINREIGNYQNQCYMTHLVSSGFQVWRKTWIKCAINGHNYDVLV